MTDDGGSMAKKVMYARASTSEYVRMKKAMLEIRTSWP